MNDITNAPLPTEPMPVAEIAPEIPAEAAPELAPEVAAPDLPAKVAVANDMTPSAVAAKLKSLFPALFGGNGFKPLKLRVQADIQERAPGVFTKAQLSAFLRRHTGSTGYLIALSKSTQRADLDGQPAGELSDEHRAAALEELTRRRGLQQERVALEQQRTAQEQTEQRERIQLEQIQRRNRAGLLYDHERTTLTLTNFCVLKGVTPEELPGLLEIARREAAEPPPQREPRPAPAGLGRTARPDRAGRPDRRGENRGRPRHDQRGKPAGSV
jgi:sRNA-binding protein